MDNVALTGMKFFRLTRGVVISVRKLATMKVSNNKTILYPQVAGTIVTYELILLQFNRDEKVPDCIEG